MTTKPHGFDDVGPVLLSGGITDAVVAAIRRAHPDMTITDYGSYLRILVPGICRLTRQALEAELGRDVRFPGELECQMPSFKGMMHMTEDVVEWRFASAN